MTADRDSIGFEVVLVFVAEPWPARQSGRAAQVEWVEAEDWSYRTDQQGLLQVSEVLA